MVLEYSSVYNYIMDYMEKNDDGQNIQDFFIFQNYFESFSVLRIKQSLCFSILFHSFFFFVIYLIFRED